MPDPLRTETRRDPTLVVQFAGTLPYPTGVTGRWVDPMGRANDGQEHDPAMVLDLDFAAIVETPVGPERIRKGDWVVTAENGERWVCHAALFAALSRVHPERPQEAWRDIAQHDGSGDPVLVLNGNDQRVAWWTGHSWVYYQKFGGYAVTCLNVSHFMPLPPIPPPPSPTEPRS
jgi:hypothetical protein